MLNAILTHLIALSTQLDADHFGLDQIKRRLIEYLAVVRLRAMAEATPQIPHTDPDINASQLAITSGEVTDQHRALVPLSTSDNVLGRPLPPLEVSRPPFSKKKGVKGPVLL